PDLELSRTSPLAKVPDDSVPAPFHLTPELLNTGALFAEWRKLTSAARRARQAAPKLNGAEHCSIGFHGAEGECVSGHRSGGFCCGSAMGWRGVACDALVSRSLGAVRRGIRSF